MKDSAALLFVTAILAACDSPMPETRQAATRAAPVASSCGDIGYLRASLSGALAADIDWNDATLRCDSMRRPDDGGVRLRFSGEVLGERLAVIIALPELGAGKTGTGFDSVVTITVEGSGRFFSTPQLGTCWADIDANEPMADDGDTNIVAGSVDCVAPLGEFNGSAWVELQGLHFSGVGNWNAT